MPRPGKIPLHRTLSSDAVPWACSYRHKRNAPGHADGGGAAVANVHIHAEALVPPGRFLAALTWRSWWVTAAGACSPGPRARSIRWASWSPTFTGTAGSGRPAPGARNGRRLRARPQSAVVISKDGHTATFRGNSVVHGRDDDGWDESDPLVLPSAGGRRPGQATRSFAACCAIRRPASGHHRNAGELGREFRFRQVQQRRPSGYHRWPATGPPRPRCHDETRWNPLPETSTSPEARQHRPDTERTGLPEAGTRGAVRTFHMSLGAG